MASLDFEFAGSNSWELQETFRALHRQKEAPNHYESQASYSSIPYIQPEGTGWQGYRDDLPYQQHTPSYLPPMRSHREVDAGARWNYNNQELYQHQDYPHEESVFPQQASATQHYSATPHYDLLPPIHPPPLVEAAAPGYRSDGVSGGFPQYAAPVRNEMAPKPVIQRDLKQFVRPYIDEFLKAPNRLAFGERSVIVLSSRVAQKSYGLEKRFLTPPPTCILLGNSWFNDFITGDGDLIHVAPRVSVCVTGEKPAVQDCGVEWTTAQGKPFDSRDPPSGTTYIGRAVGKHLFISVDDDKAKKVEALVTVTARVSEKVERVIGVFPSRPIKVISKPSKKKQSNKSVELSINHGSVISLFHRLRSQTVSTKYLCVSGASSAYTGSDGNRLVGSHLPGTAPSFVARTATWDPFIIYIVDVSKPQGAVDTLPPSPPPHHPEYPSPPPNAIDLVANGGTQTPICYNQTVVLQCLTSGVVSPILIIRKVDHSTIAVGGGKQDGAKASNLYCVQGDVCGDTVSQLHKIGFEVYDYKKRAPERGFTGETGVFLSCMGDKVNTFGPTDGRQWNPFSVPLKARSASPPPSTPIGISSRRGPLSRSASPGPDSTTCDGGKVPKTRRSTASAGFTSKAPLRGRRRAGSAGSAGSAANDISTTTGALWQVDIGETSVWTIVGTDQVRYNFYVPPVLFNDQSSPRTHAFPVPHTPVTPLPQVCKYLPPGVAAENTKHNTSSARLAAMQVDSHDADLITIYGENFDPLDPPQVFFGSEPSKYVEVRCMEVLACLPPDTVDPTAPPRNIILVRSDGVSVASGVKYP